MPNHIWLWLHVIVNEVCTILFAVLCFDLITILINTHIQLDCLTLSFSFNWFLFKTLTAQAWSAMQWTRTVSPHLNICVVLCVQAWHSHWAWAADRRLACITRPWSTATSRRGPTRLLTSSLSYVKRPRALRIKYTPFVSHTPGVLSHTHPVSCLTATHACNTHTLCHV